MKTDKELADEMRDLDAWIAEHVMGWTWWRFEVCGEKWCQLVPPDERWPWRQGFNGIKCKHALKNMENRTDLSMFRPTTDAAAAMMVLKRCAKETTFPILTGVKADGWYCELGDGLSGDWKGYQTLELAICLFAKNLFSK